MRMVDSLLLSSILQLLKPQQVRSYALANFENRPVAEVLNDLLSPDADTLR